MLKRKLSTCYPEDPFYSPLDKRFGNIMGYDFKKYKGFYRLKIGKKGPVCIVASCNCENYVNLSLARGLLDSSDIIRMEEHKGRAYFIEISSRKAGEILTQQMYQRERNLSGIS